MNNSVTGYPFDAVSGGSPGLNVGCVNDHSMNVLPIDSRQQAGTIANERNVSPNSIIGDSEGARSCKSFVEFSLSLFRPVKLRKPRFTRYNEYNLAFAKSFLCENEFFRVVDFGVMFHK